MRHALYILLITMCPLVLTAQNAEEVSIRLKQQDLVLEEFTPAEDVREGELPEKSESSASKAFVR